MAEAYFKEQTIPQIKGQHSENQSRVWCFPWRLRSLEEQQANAASGPLEEEHTSENILIITQRPGAAETRTVLGPRPASFEDSAAPETMVG